MVTKKILTVVGLTIIYLSIAIVFTWPLAKNISTHGFGVDEDSPYHIWHNWWLKYSIFDLKQNPLYTNYIFYPQTVPLAFDANAFVFGALTIPIQLVTNNVIFASNIIFLLSFALSGLGMYWLANHYCRSKIASAMAGVIYAFAPYVFAQAIDGHINLTSIWIIPFYALALENLWKRSLEKGLKDKMVPTLVLLTGILISLQAYNDLTYTAFLMFFTTIYISIKVINNIVKRQTEKKEMREIVIPLVPLAMAGVLSLIIFLPALIPTLKAYQSGLTPDADLKTQAVWSADLISFIKPPDFLKFFGEKWQFTAKQGTVEATVFPGYAPLILTIAAVILLFRKRADQDKETLLTWLAVTIAFFIFSLGPWLKINNQAPGLTILGKSIHLYLPYALLHKVPIIGGTQEPARMNPYLMLGLAVISALMIEKLLTVYKSKKNSTLVTVFAGCLATFVLGERWPIDFPTTDLRAPKIYQQIAKDREDFSVLNLPIGFNSGQIALGVTPIGSLQFFQTIHLHPSFRGTVARLPISAFDYYRQLPLFKYLLSPNDTPDSDDLNKELVKETFKKQLNIKYIVIHKDKYTKIPLGETENLIKEVLGGKLISEEGQISAYQI